MHVVINAQLISDQHSYRSAGVNAYSRNLLRALGDLTAGNENVQLTALRNLPAASEDGVCTQATSLPLHIPIARIAWEQLVLPGLLVKLDADIVHGLVNVLPLASSIPSVVTVHDLSFLHFPHLFPPSKRLYLTALCKASVQKAAAVIAVSQQTADDVVQQFGVFAQKVTIIHNGVDERFTPGNADEINEFRRAKRLPERFFLYLGTLEPRKNLETLLTAYADWRKQASPSDGDIKLVIAGGKGWFYESIFSQTTALNLREHVFYPGYVPDEELPMWYKAALGLFYPSLFEGFGLPVLEAMACGTPVVCSDIAALREVAGDAVLLLPPTDVDAWTAGFAMMAGQPNLQAELSARGRIRSERFTWTAAASKTLGVYLSIA